MVTIGRRFLQGKRKDNIGSLRKNDFHRKSIQVTEGKGVLCMNREIQKFTENGIK